MGVVGVKTDLCASISAFKSARIMPFDLWDSSLHYVGFVEQR